MTISELAKWPGQELEAVPLCPVCGSNERDLAHSDLVDDTFFSAPGKWDLWQCRACQSGWLDPRPDRASIGRAYSNYFTHEPPASSPNAGERESIRHRLGNGYRNWRFGTRLKPASALGRLAAAMMPGIRRRIDDEYRMLPRPFET
ncbi:MAG: class I SAM-dependent methyltransferase, partial [Gammaproteobacteria bacterium]